MLSLCIRDPAITELNFRLRFMTANSQLSMNRLPTGSCENGSFISADGKEKQSMRTILKNCKVAGRPGQNVIYIDGGKFADAFEESAADEVIDVKGRTVVPGLVDMHIHLREPGYEYKETIATGCASAAKGGYTSVCPMPNTKPVADNAAVIEAVVKKAQEAGLCRVYPIGAATKGIEGDQISEMGLMKEAGIVAVSDDGRPIKNAGIMRKVLEYSSDFDLPVLNHCEDKDLSEGAMNEGEVSTSIGIRGIPTAAEDIMIARDIILSEYLNIPVHICHVSTMGGVRMIKGGKGTRGKRLPVRPARTISP